MKMKMKDVVVVVDVVVFQDATTDRRKLHNREDGEGNPPVLSVGQKHRSTQSDVVHCDDAVVLFTPDLQHSTQDQWSFPWNDK